MDVQANPASVARSIDAGGADGGPIDIATAALPDLHGWLAHLRARGPVARVRFHGMPAWLLTRHRDVAAAFRDGETFPSQAAYRILAEPVMGRTLQCMEGEEHRVHRLLVSPTFRPRAVAALAERLVRPTAHEVVDGFAARGSAELVVDFTRRFPFAVITRLIGIPASTEWDFQRWVDVLFNFPSDPEGALAGSAELTRYLTGIVAERRRAPADDLLSMLAAAEIEGQRLSDEEIFSFVRLLFPAGGDTTYLGIGSLVHALLTHPGAMRAALADPDARRRAIGETLRCEPPVPLQPRRSVRASTWGEPEAPGGVVEIPAEAWVIFGTASANRDPDVFPDPDRFCLDRDNREAILTFGLGTHYCLGEHLARLELAVALDVLLERLPGLRLVDPDDVAVAGGILRGPTALRVAFDS